MENSDFYWFWLCNLKGIGRRKIRSLIDYFNNPENVYLASEGQLKQIKNLTEKDISTILNNKNETKIYNDYKHVFESGAKILHINSKEYPKRLNNIPDSPVCMYYKGTLPDENIPSVAIVGARNCTTYGRKTAYELAGFLAEKGACVISGMAAGVDVAAHRGALEAGGFTYSVLGCGVNVCYPAQNIEVYEQIKRNGCLISEYPVDEKPYAGHFPERNRIISGLCDILILVEARQKSGSLITVDQALEQNREIFVVPGRIGDDLSRGCNDMIKQGAEIITCPEDILESSVFSSYIKKDSNRKIFLNQQNASDYKGISNAGYNNFETNGLATEKNIVYSCLNLYPKSMDDLIKETGYTVEKLSELLLLMQLDGVIENVAGNCYVRNHI